MRLGIVLLLLCLPCKILSQGQVPLDLEIRDPEFLAIASVLEQEANVPPERLALVWDQLKKSFDLANRLYVTYAEARLFVDQHGSPSRVLNEIEMLFKKYAEALRALRIARANEMLDEIEIYMTNVQTRIDGLRDSGYFLPTFEQADSLQDLFAGGWPKMKAVANGHLSAAPYIHDIFPLTRMKTETILNELIEAVRDYDSASDSNHFLSWHKRMRAKKTALTKLDQLNELAYQDADFKRGPEEFARNVSFILAQRLKSLEFEVTAQFLEMSRARYRAIPNYVMGTIGLLHPIPVMVNLVFGFIIIANAIQHQHLKIPENLIAADLLMSLPWYFVSGGYFKVVREQHFKRFPAFKQLARLLDEKFKDLPQMKQLELCEHTLAVLR
jgi:hypothetical protein